MPIKFLSLQMLPWCFHIMGNTTTTTNDDGNDEKKSKTTTTTRLIKSDGEVKIYYRPIKASELMAEFPCHLVCRSDSFCIGQKVPALSESDHLLPGNSYFLLPNHFFQSVLSFVTIASSFAKAAAGATATERAAMVKTFDIHRTPSGALQIRVSDEFIERMKGEEGGEGSSSSSKVCTTAALEKDYKQLVRCKSQQWKPKLETIREAKRRRMVVVGLGGDAFGRIMSMKKKKNQTREKKKAHPPPPPPPPPSRNMRKKF